MTVLIHLCFCIYNDDKNGYLLDIISGLTLSVRVHICAYVLRHQQLAVTEEYNMVVGEYFLMTRRHRVMITGTDFLVHLKQIMIDLRVYCTSNSNRLL